VWSLRWLTVTAHTVIVSKLLLTKMDEQGREILKSAMEACDVKRKANLWQQKLDEQASKSRANPFSQNFTGETSLDHLSKEEYGRPVEGSLTDIRGKQAASWVDHEVDKLVGEILKIGRFDPSEGGLATVAFGELFLHYQDISNTVVGILMRAKKRKRVKYEGEMLFQHSSKNVKITALS